MNFCNKKPDTFWHDARLRQLTREQRFLRILPRLEFIGDCWVWRGSRRGGNNRRDPSYGQMSFHGGNHYVHRVVYELFVGPIPPHGVVDHTHNCEHQGLCVNPRFLELTSHRVNNQRAAALTHHGNRYAYEDETWNEF